MINEHTHNHSHPHVGGGEGDSTDEKVLAILTYLAGHNKNHANELKELAELTEASGNPDQAGKLYECVGLYEQIHDIVLDVLKVFKENR